MLIYCFASSESILQVVGNMAHKWIQFAVEAGYWDGHILLFLMLSFALSVTCYRYAGSEVVCVFPNRKCLRSWSCLHDTESFYCCISGVLQSHLSHVDLKGRKLSWTFFCGTIILSARIIETVVRVIVSCSTSDKETAISCSRLSNFFLYPPLRFKVGLNYYREKYHYMKKSHNVF